MRPRRNSRTVQIPITFDSSGGGRIAQAGRPLWLFLVLIFWVVSSILVAIASDTAKGLLYAPISFFILTYVVRYLILRELFFREKRKKLMENDYLFDHSIFWNIYDISRRYPHITYFGSGLKGIFVALDKDVIVGKDDDYEYDHHEAIADAYQQLQKRGIEAIHIDYMDTVGKDTRMSSLFSQAEKTQNPDLRRVVTRMYDHIEYKMNKSYATYDVYCFYTYARDDIFWDELQIVLDYFRQANYIRARVLDRESISHLVESLMNLTEFSVNRANDTMFKSMNKTDEYLRVIWTEKDGERTEVNKTLEEIAEIKRVAQAEKKVKRKGGKLKSFKRNKEEEQDINLFD